MQNRREEKRQINIFCWMINSDKQVEKLDKPKEMSDEINSDYVATANAFEDSSIKERCPLIVDSLDYVRDKKRRELFVFQCIEDSILADFAKYLESNGLKWISHKYTPTKMALNYLLAYDPKAYSIKKAELRYLTETGSYLEDWSTRPRAEVLKHNLQSFFGRSMQEITLCDLTDKSEFVVVNVHFDKNKEHRIQAGQKLCDWLAPISLPIVIVGNQGQSDVGKTKPALYKRQIELYIRNGYRWDGEMLFTKNPHGGFVTYPRNMKFFKELAEDSTLNKAASYRVIRKFFVDRIAEKDVSLFITALNGVYTKKFTYPAGGIQRSSCKALLFEYRERIKSTPAIETTNKFAKN